MKSLEELIAIKARMQDQVALRLGGAEIKIVVKMGTSGIEAGARDVLNAFVEEVSAAGLAGKVTVSQNGYGGACANEPIVEVYEKNKEKVTYVKMTADRAKDVVAKHIKGGAPVKEYTEA